MYIPLSDDKHQFVQKVHSACANGHWEHGSNSNPVATLPHAAVVFRMQPFNYKFVALIGYWCTTTALLKILSNHKGNGFLL